LAVATVPYRTFDNKLAFFSNDTYGVEMNQNAGFSDGTPDEIHNGTDNAGTATATTADKLVDANQDFTDSIYVGMTVYNTTDSTTATVTAIDDATTLSIVAAFVVTPSEILL